MNIGLFLKNKIQRAICRDGKVYSFIRKKEDDYHQKTNEIENVIFLKGIFHGTNSYIKPLPLEGASITSKNIPMILCLYEESKFLKKDDEVEISGKIYKVVDKTNIQNLDIACDISLEEIK